TSFFYCHVFSCPSCQRKLWMLGMVTTCNVIMIFEKHFSVGRDKYGPKRFVAFLKRGLCEFDTTFQVLQIYITYHKRTLLFLFYTLHLLIPKRWKASIKRTDAV